MKKTELREFLNKPSISFNVALHKLTEFVLDPYNKALIANYIITALKAKPRFTSVDMFIAFYNATKGLVEKTKLCSTLYAEQIFLKTVWESSQFQILIINAIKNNYKLLEVPVRKEEAIAAQALENKAAKQAALMREARARNRIKKLIEQGKLPPEELDKFNQNPRETVAPIAEKKVETAAPIAEKKVETVTKLTEQKEIKSQPVPQSLSQPAPQPQSKFSKEQLEQIALLRGMRP